MKERRELLRLNRILSDPRVIVIILIGYDLLLFGAFNYCVNILCNLSLIFQDITHMGAYLGGKNLLPNIAWIASSGLGKFLYAWFGVVMVIGDIVIASKMRIAYSAKTINADQKGDQRWTTLEELQQQYRMILERTASYEGPPGIPIAHYQEMIFIDDSNCNNLILGITRSGKDEMLAYKSIDSYSRCLELPSIIDFDPKKEAFKSSKVILEKRGYLVYLLDMADPTHSMRWNPLLVMVGAWKEGRKDEAQLLARTFAYSIFCPDQSTSDQAFFNDNATNCLVALIIAMIEDCLAEDDRINDDRYYAYSQKRKKFDALDDEKKEQARKDYDASEDYRSGNIIYIPDDVVFVKTSENEKKINMYSIIYVFRMLQSQPVPDTYLTALDLYFKNRDPMDMALMAFSAIEVAGGVRTKGSIYSTMLSKLIAFTYEANAKMTAESDIRLEDIGFGDKPYAIFISMPDYDKSNHFLATAFINQLYFILSKKCGETGECKRWVKVIANELGNVPPIYEIDSKLTVGLGRKISFDLYFQSYGQIETKYKDAAKTILDNVGNKFYIMAADYNSAERFSKEIGNRTGINIDRTGSVFGLSKTLVERPEEEPLIRPNELQELMEGEMVIKRTMKRRDLNGKPIRPRPIFDTGPTRMKYRYTYMLDDFPIAKKIDIRDLVPQNRPDINLREIVWNPDITFKRLKEEQQGNISDKIRIRDLQDAKINMIQTAISNVYGTDFWQEHDVEAMGESDLAALISADDLLKDVQKNAILQILVGDTRSESDKTL